VVAAGGAVALAAGLITAMAPAASAGDSTMYLEGATGVGDVVVGGGKVFVAAADRIVLADSRGTLTDAVTGLSGAVGLAISPEGSRLTPP
jgi:hypothetical protein